MIDNAENLEMLKKEVVMLEANDLPPEFPDGYILARVLLPKEGSFIKGLVIACMHESDGTTRDTANSNPILDSCVYKVQFSDGYTVEYAVNVIAEAIYVQVDEEGHEHLILDEIIKYHNDTAIFISDMSIIL
jgi:hypothetical protein